MAKDRISCFTITGFVFVIIAIGFVVFASAFPYWWELVEERDTGVLNIGLWEICFDDKGFTAPSFVRDDFQKRYYGCSYVFDRDLRKIVHWIFPDWYTTVVTFVTLGLLTLPLCVILITIYMVRVCSPHMEHILVGVACLLSLLQGLLTVIAIVLFGVKSSRDRDWMPQPESNHLSYSYGMCAVVPVLCFIAATSFAIDYLRLHTQRLINARAKVYSKGEFNNRY